MEKALNLNHHYHHRSPENSVLYKILAENLEPFLAKAEEKGSGFPDYVKDALREFL